MALGELENFRDEKFNKKIIIVLCKKLTEYKSKTMLHLVHFTVQKLYERISFWKSCFSNDTKRKSKPDIDSFIKKDKTEKSFSDLIVTRLLSEGDLHSHESFVFLSFPKTFTCNLKIGTEEYSHKSELCLQIKTLSNSLENNILWFCSRNMQNYLKQCLYLIICQRS